MKFLITGILGFNGPHLVKKLIQEGHEVFGLCNREPSEISDVLGNDITKITFLYGDLLDRNSISSFYKCRNNETYHFDGVFHLAAMTHPPTSFLEPEKFFKVNALGSISLYEEMIKLNPDVVWMQCGTCESYGNCKDYEKIDENFPLNPLNPYAISKTAADMYLLERARNTKSKIFITRAFSHTGPRRMPNYSIASDAVQIAKIIKGKQENKIRVGNLKCKRVVMDVRDVVDVYYKLMMKMIDGEMKSGEIFNIGGDDVHTIHWYIKKMLQLFDVQDVKLIKDEKLFRPIDIPVMIPNSDKVRKFLNWKPKIKIENTLLDLVNYWINKL